MSTHVNGWPVINQFLKKKNKKQLDMAKLLSISPSAVSQIKNGEYLLSPQQMKNLCDYLEFDLNAADTFYTGIFNARIMSKSRTIPAQKFPACRPSDLRDQLSGNTRAVPMLKLSQMHAFQPLFTPLVHYMEQNDCDFLHFPPDKIKINQCAFKIDIFSPEHIGLPDQALIFVEAGKLPASGDLCLFKTLRGEIHIKEIIVDRHLVFFKSSQNRRRNEMVWDRELEPMFLQWIFPVIEIVIKT